jgi:glycerophosphoryl diester phosphodiesterase
MNLPDLVPAGAPVLDGPGSRLVGAPVLTIAHRGASARAPENTLAAIREAAALGADAVEIDVQRTRDGALVLLHDATLARTTDASSRYPRRGPWSVGSLTLLEVRALDAGSWKSPRFARERVPTLRHTLRTIGELGDLRLLLELKLPERHPGIVADLARVLEDAQRDGLLETRRVVVQSFDVTAMKELKARCPELEVGVLGLPPRAHLPALATWASQVNPHHASLDASYVEAVHANGMRCLTWTVDRPFAMRRAIRAGVDGVITNRPDVLLRQSEPR